MLTLTNPKPKALPCFLSFFRTQTPTSSASSSATAASSSSSSLLPETVEPPETANHGSLCLSLLDSLLRRGLPSAAHSLLERIVTRFPISDALSAVRRAYCQGLSVDHARLVPPLVSSGQFLKAHSIFFLASPRLSDPSLLDSMLLCYCKLGDLSQALVFFDSIIKLGSFPSSASYNSLLRLFFYKYQLLDAFNLIVSAGIRPPEWSYSVLIPGLCSKGYLNEACFLFDLMLGAGVRPTVRMFKSLIYGFCRQRRVLDAERVCRVMESHGFYVDRTLYTAMLYGYCKEGRMDLALGLFERIKKTTWCKPDAYVYNTMIYGLLKLGSVDLGWDFFYEMSKCGFGPDVVTYSLMISWYCKNTMVDSALRHLEAMVRDGLSPNLCCYTAVITSLCKGNRLIEAEQLFDKMLNDGLLPDGKMFVLLMRNLPKSHELNIVCKILHAIARKNCNTDFSTFFKLSNSCSDEPLQREAELLFDEIMSSNIIPLQVVFKILVSTFCSVGRYDIACIFLDKMVGYEDAEHVVPAYNFLLKCLCKHGRIEDAESLISLMRQRGVLLNLATYSIIIDSYCKQGDIDLAIGAFDEMIELRLRPNVIVYDSIIGALCKAGRIDDAEFTFDSMLKAGAMPDEVVYTTLLNGYSKMGRATDAHHLFDSMVTHGVHPSSRAYSALINGLMKNNMIKTACKYLKMMLEDGFVPDTVLYTMLINQFLRKGDVSLALDLVVLMLRNQIEPDLKTYGAVISGLCGTILHRRRIMDPHLAEKLVEGRHLLFRLLAQDDTISGSHRQSIRCRTTAEKIKLAMDFMQDLVDVGFVPDLHIQNGMILGLCRANIRTDACICWMKKKGIIPNQVTFTILMDSYIRSGDIDLAIGLFNQMNGNECVADKVAHNTLIKGCSIFGRAIEALCLVHMMRKRGLFPSETSCDMLLGSLCQSQDSDLAFKLFEEMISYGYIPERSKYNNLLSLLVEEENLWAAHRIFDLMLKRGKTPDHTTKRHLIDMCFKLGEYDLAFEIEENIPVYEE